MYIYTIHTRLYIRLYNINVEWKYQWDIFYKTSYILGWCKSLKVVSLLVFRDDCIRVCFILLLSLALFRGVFRTMLNIYDAPSLRKKLIVICEQLFSIISISGFWQVRKYAAALVCKYFTPVDRQLFIQIKRSLQFVNLQ